MQDGSMNLIVRILVGGLTVQSRMYEFDKGAELSMHFYEPEDIEDATHLHVIDAAEKTRLEEKQKEVYWEQGKKSHREEKVKP
jgi:hypothetical protein